MSGCGPLQRLMNKETNISFTAEQKDLARRAGQLLVRWYPAHARALPWREAPSPYEIWVSEIMLQQTRIETVKRYYPRFLAEFPDEAALARSDEGALLKVWEGLGYYSRARHMKQAAEEIVRRYDGKLPADYEALRALPGIGDYTAGAIASIAFGLPHPAIDGNVLRVSARLLKSPRDIADTKTRRMFSDFLAETMDKREPGVYNEALMEVGETLCLPKGEPLCGSCPLRELCLTHLDGETNRYPVRSGKKARRVEERTVLLLEYGGKLLIRQRPQDGLLGGLYEPASLAGNVELETIESFEGARLEGTLEPAGTRRHIFTHVEWLMTGYSGRLAGVPAGEWILADADELAHRYALPAAYQPFIEQWRNSHEKNAADDQSDLR